MKHATTLNHLARTRGKAELVDGRIQVIPPSGFLPGFAAAALLSALTDYASRHRTGYALGARVTFKVDLPKRKSFSPDVAFFQGVPSGMKFLEGAPLFAVEVRSENDYGPKAEKLIAAKIKDYFSAGTQIVWDVDLTALEIIKAYSASDPATLRTFTRRDTADAEPVLPAWRLELDLLFPFYVNPKPE